MKALNLSSSSFSFSYFLLILIHCHLPIFLLHPILFLLFPLRLDFPHPNNVNHSLKIQRFVDFTARKSNLCW
jgi:hypothetical protein